MVDDDFEWNETKARKNYRDHGVTFDWAKRAFADPFAVALIDDREDYGEERFNLLGIVEGQLLNVTYTERSGRCRLISARRATKKEDDDYFMQNAQS
jgi:uncharacterized protein